MAGQQEGSHLSIVRGCPKDQVTSPPSLIEKDNNRNQTRDHQSTAPFTSILDVSLVKHEECIPSRIPETEYTIRRQKTISLIKKKKKIAYLRHFIITG